MQTIYDLGAAKRPTNLSINSDLLRQARELDINLSHTFEQALAEAVSRKRADRWLQENREAIAQYNVDSGATRRVRRGSQRVVDTL